MSLPIKPLGDRVLIQADPEDHAPLKTESGIYLAGSLAAAVTGEDAGTSWCVGTVVAVGPDVQPFDVRPFVRRRLVNLLDFSTIPHGAVRTILEDLDDLPHATVEPVQVGDRVTFSWAAGQEMTVDDQKYLIMHVHEVLAVLEAEVV
jgi:co-chaperonin GroES (HSP10)